MCKRKLSVLSALSAVILLTSCSGGETAVTSSNSSDSVTTAVSEVVTSEAVPDTIQTVSGLSESVSDTAESTDGNSSQTENASVTKIGFLGEEADVCPSEQSAPDGNGTLYDFSGYCYIAPSDGKVDVMTFDEYGKRNFSFNSGEYTKIEVGTKFGDYVLNEAYGWIVYTDDNEDTKGELAYETMVLEGSQSMKGYIYTYAEDDAYCAPGDVYFLPADGEWEGFPACGFGNIYMFNDNFVWVGNAPGLYLGNSDTDYIADIDNLERGKVYEVTVVLSDMTLKEALCENSTFSMQLKTATLTEITEYNPQAMTVDS